ncbi:hypothetical protein HHK36_023385 [Tetracentron sinense]|uniref:F-box domain-containing protein n=1 Tax=Tetracentron sinense TaxID=13715 RepID=A0A834YN45_TETSI|nr:hypothetical protein HHK36_023385 [Tetracentron sinense]
MERGEEAKKKKGNSNDTEEEKDSLSKLPRDILLDIFSRIPAKSLFDSRWVCKSWLNLVRDPRLAKIHLTRATQNENPSIIFESDGNLYLLDNLEESNVLLKLKFPFMASNPSFELVGSCNGLVCVREALDINHSIYIFNPVTGECAEKMELRDEKVKLHNYIGELVILVVEDCHGMKTIVKAT